MNTEKKEIKKEDVKVATNKSSHSYLEQKPMQVRQNIAMPNWLKALLALLPALFFLLLFTIYPIINTTLISFIKDFKFQKGSGSFVFSSFFKQLDLHNNFIIDEGVIGGSGGIEPPPKPIFSFHNYVEVFKEDVFFKALWNTTILTLISVPATILISLLLAVALNSIKPLRGMYQTIFFLPYVTNTIALGIVFNVLFSAEIGGLMNQMRMSLGMQPISWIRILYKPVGGLAMTRWSLGFVIIIQSIWTGLAFKILVFMAGLASIDKQYYDAARIDGSSRRRIFSKITVPLLSPQILYITITSFIGSFKAYQSIIAVVGGGSYNFGGITGEEWITVVGYIYKTRHYEDTIPIAAAGAIILLIIIFLITLVQMQVSKRRVHY